MEQLPVFSLEMVRLYSIPIQVHHTHTHEQVSEHEPTHLPQSQLTIVERQQHQTQYQ